MTGRASFHLLESDKGWEGGDMKAQGGMDSWGEVMQHSGSRTVTELMAPNDLDLSGGNGKAM